MGQGIRSSLARCLAVLATPLLLLGVMAGTASASVPSPRQAVLSASDGVPGDEAGYSVALSAAGTTALIGAPRHSGAGTAYVFRLRGRTWTRTAELTGSGATEGDDFGISVGLSSSGSTILAGAPGRTSDTGAAYVLTGRSR